MTRHSLQARVLLGILATTACGGHSPTAPTDPLSGIGSPPGIRALQTGPKVLSLTGFDFSNDPAKFPPCLPIGVPRDGKNVSTLVTLTNEGTDWVARPMPGASNNLLLRFHQTATSLAGVAMVGTIEGAAADQTDSVHTATDVRVLLGGTNGLPAQVEGMADLGGYHVAGRITGELTFTDSAGAASTCTAVEWFLQ